ncbi:MAG: ATP-binding protein [Planctomycetes bacterium]|nr:ATP-binding protein [Planctomycetota bacterium]
MDGPEQDTVAGTEDDTNAPTDLKKPPPGDGPAAPVVVPKRLPDWYPAWARALAELYFSGTTCLFVLHGNVNDNVCVAGTAEDETTYGSLPDFLATRLFGRWDVVLSYDLGRGLRPLAGSDPARLREMVTHTAALGEPSRWPRTPEKAFFMIDRYLNRTLLQDKDDGPASVAIVIQHAEYVVPSADIASVAHAQGSLLVRLLEWARSPHLKRQNIAFCLIANNLSEMNSRLIKSPYVAAIEIPMPADEERSRFATWATGDEDDLAAYSDFTADQLAAMSNGLSLVDLNIVLAQARTGTRHIDGAMFRSLKKSLIERQCYGLLEFFEPSHTMDMVVGHGAAKDRLRGDADIITRGQLDFAPMGYLICGPVGTGKTFLAECYAGSIGIPCVKLRNFRSKYVGETEGNLERVLTVLRSLGPVVVIIDEADAALGTREASGDSGTSSRVFSMIASQMGDTRYRGKIVWMLLTSRPDRLPVDLKRQGRAEVHIPLFYPSNEDEYRAMFRVMGRKNKVRLADDAVAHVEPGPRRLSGSDIESVVLAANRLALTDQRRDVTRADVDVALRDFIPSAQGLEREAQELSAVLECTQLGFLPEAWREKVDQPNGRTAIQERLVAIRQILED